MKKKVVKKPNPVILKSKIIIECDTYHDGTHLLKVNALGINKLFALGMIENAKQQLLK